MTVRAQKPEIFWQVVLGVAVDVITFEWNGFAHPFGVLAFLAAVSAQPDQSSADCSSLANQSSFEPDNGFVSKPIVLLALI